jgi:hypothetical protein
MAGPGIKRSARWQSRRGLLRNGGLVIALSLLTTGIVLSRRDSPVVVSAQSTRSTQPVESAQAAERPQTLEVCDNRVPQGAIAPAVAEFCKGTLPAGVTTRVERANSWVDDFNHGQSHAGLPAEYSQGSLTDGVSAIQFQHNEHWMVDLRGEDQEWPTAGMAWMRPGRAFATEAGRLVVEFEVAGPIPGTRDSALIGDSWPEVVVSTAPRPTHLRSNGTYLYEGYEGAWTFGCRLQQSKHPICSLYGPEPGGAGSTARRWEINQNGLDVRSEWGGDPSVAGLEKVWVGCDSESDPDTVCRNQFRLELAADGVKLLVNGQTYYEAELQEASLGSLLTAPTGLHVYFGSVAYQLAGGAVVRFHWDRIAVNP